MFDVEYATTDGQKVAERHDVAEVTAQGLYTRDGHVQAFMPWHTIGGKVTIVELDENRDPVPEPRKPEIQTVPPLDRQRPR